MGPHGAAAGAVAGAALLAAAAPVLALRPGIAGPAAAAAAGAVAGLAALPAGVVPALSVAAVMAGFALLLAGTVRVLSRGCPPAAAVAVGGLVACALVALPFLGDPLVEAGEPGRESPGAIAALVDGTPLAPALGSGLGVDFLKSPRVYGGAAPGLSRIGAFYAYGYPGVLPAAAGWAAAGALLLGVAGLARRRTGP